MSIQGSTTLRLTPALRVLDVKGPGERDTPRQFVHLFALIGEWLLATFEQVPEAPSRCEAVTND